LGDRLVVLVLQTVKVHRKGQVGAGREEVQLLLQQERVGAEIDEALAGHQGRRDLADLLVNQRLAPRDRDHRRAAVLDRLDALGDRKAPVQDLLRIVDLAAARTGEIAAEQRLQHEHQGIALPAEQALLQDVGPDPELLPQGYRQEYYSSRPAAPL
jgi:hypothetical protein